MPKHHFDDTRESIGLSELSKLACTLRELASIQQDSRRLYRESSTGLALLEVQVMTHI